MNNGVTTNNNSSVPESQNTLTPMAGVKIAPAEGMPVDASSKESATSAVNKQSPVVATPQPAVAPAPPVVSAPPVTPQPAPVTPPAVEPPVVNTPAPQPAKPAVPEPPALTGPPPAKKSSIVPILLIIIIGLIGYAIYSTKTYTARIESLNYNCTPVTASKEDKELPLDSTLVTDLYNKVATNIREDLAQPEFNDNMKLYLAYRQISDEAKYDTNCNLFSKTAMEPYTCEESTKFKPKAFKEETLILEWKKLFGEKTEVPLANVRLGDHSCIGGYQYIPKRGEFVQGLCGRNTATSYKVTKTLTKATSNRTTIILTEEVQYHEAEKVSLPETLKNGTYYYTFRLDMNYNYVFVSKTYKSKY